MRAVIAILGILFLVSACRSVPEKEGLAENTPTRTTAVATMFSVEQLQASSLPVVSPTLTPTPTLKPATETSVAATSTALLRTPGVTETRRARGTVAHGETTRPNSKPTATPVILDMLVPLTDMDERNYLGFQGGLYPDDSNDAPTKHAEVGRERAALIQPLDLQGNPDPQGKIVLLSVGMSNTSQEFCFGRQARTSCLPWTFVGMAEQDAEVNQRSLAMIDGARGGQVASKWDSPEDENYARVRDDILVPLNLSEEQVQIIWLKVANPGPRFSLPNERADAYLLMATMGDIVRALQVRYPNLQQVYVSSRIYAGYTSKTLNPEPFAYETGFAVKWLIEAQIRQMTNEPNQLNNLAGDLNYNTVAPWMAWGPYLWARGTTPRADGLVWEPADFDTDNTHPSRSGETKVAAMLMDFFKTSPFTQCWFLSGGLCTGD